MSIDVWQPLAQAIAQKQKMLNRPLIQGILGPQGIGKTTLSKALVAMLGTLGLKAVSVSLDDIYKTYAERKIIQQKNPHLIWRGPPGTHDVSLGIELFNQVLSSQAKIPIWRFDKSLHQGQGDRIAEPEIVEGIDILIFEGWFVGDRPLDWATVGQLPEPITTTEDYNLARASNDGLYEYLPLWDKLDKLLILYPKDYRYSLQWRLQAEEERKKQGQAGLGAAEIEAFVFYFWRSLHPHLYINPLLEDPRYTSLVIDYHHNVKRIYTSDANS